jgi:hypothetical protein
MICLDTCGTAGDTVCQDGGWKAFGSMCEFGTDCSDCGPRLLLDPPPSPPVFPGFLGFFFLVTFTFSTFSTNSLLSCAVATSFLASAAFLLSATNHDQRESGSERPFSFASFLFLRDNVQQARK